MLLKDHLQPGIQRLGDGKGAVVQHRAEHLDICMYQILFHVFRRLTAGGVRFNNQHHSVGQLTEHHRVVVKAGSRLLPPEHSQTPSGVLGNGAAAAPQ